MGNHMATTLHLGRFLHVWVLRELCQDHRKQGLQCSCTPRHVPDSGCANLLCFVFVVPRLQHVLTFKPVSRISTHSTEDLSCSAQIGALHVWDSDMSVSTEPWIYTQVQLLRHCSWFFHPVYEYDGVENMIRTWRLNQQKHDEMKNL